MKPETWFNLPTRVELRSAFSVIANCLVPTANCLLPTAYCVLRTAYCLLIFSRPSK